MRAMVEQVVDANQRPDRRAPLDAAVHVYVESRQRAAHLKAQQMAPERRLGLVLEGQYGHIESFLPQNTWLKLDGSSGYGMALGLRYRLASRVPVLSQFMLLGEYGQVRNTFKGSFGGQKLESTLHQLSLELLYRPRVASWLKPFLRGGLGVFPMSATVGCDAGGEQPAEVQSTELGGLLGGGIDFLRLRSLGLRSSVVGSYRILTYQLERLASLACEDQTWIRFPSLEFEHYELKMNGWQVGIMLTLER